MRTGKLAGVTCSSGWNLIYTAPRNEHGAVTMGISTIDGTAVTVLAAHVKQGNQGTGEARVDSDIIMSPLTITSETVVISELGIESLDDLFVNADVADKVVVSVSTEGLEHQREVPRQ